MIFLPCLLSLAAIASTPSITAAAPKSRVPVLVRNIPSPGGTTLELVFEGDVSDAEIAIWGLDGLMITKAESLPRRSFLRGEKVKLVVSYVSKTTASHLAVGLGGLVNGSRQRAIQTFAVGDLAKSIQARASRPIRTSEGVLLQAPSVAKREKQQ